LTYGVFGDPPRTALALAGVAGPNQILVDAAVAAELRNGWILSVDHDVVDLRGEQMVAEVLEGRREATTDVSS
jgi:class 3 adenylate cyclase